MTLLMLLFRVQPLAGTACAFHLDMHALQDCGVVLHGQALFGAIDQLPAPARCAGRTAALQSGSHADSAGLCRGCGIAPAIL